MKHRDRRDDRLWFPVGYRPGTGPIVSFTEEPVLQKSLVMAALEHIRTIPVQSIPDTTVTFLLGA